jgi:hypothetical protein
MAAQALNDWYSAKTLNQAIPSPAGGSGLLAATGSITNANNAGLTPTSGLTPVSNSAKTLNQSVTYNQRPGINGAVGSVVNADRSGLTPTSGLVPASSESSFTPVRAGALNSAPNKPMTDGNNSQVSATTLGGTNTYKARMLDDPTQWNIDNNQTVAGQLNNIMAADSPLMQQARTAGLDQANSRGMLNSSMAIGAAQDSVISHATPIAQSDATAYLGANRYNADQSNQFATINAAAKNTERQFNKTALNDTNRFNAQAKGRAKEFNATNAYNSQQTDKQNEFNKSQSLFDANTKASLAQIDNMAKWNQSSQQIYGGLSDGFNKAIAAINQDTNMNQQSKDYSIQQLFKSYKAQISMLSAIGSVADISKLLRGE